LQNLSLLTWIKAARLRTIPLSISGILVGSASAYANQSFDSITFVLTLLTTISYQLLSNFANDYGDGVKGTDNSARLGPRRILQTDHISKNKLRTVVVLLSIVAFTFTVSLVYVAFGFSTTALSFLGLGFAAILAAILYTVGSNAYGYKGLGDAFVFLFFGLVSVLGSNYLYCLDFDFSLLLPGSAIGLLSVAVLNLNNMRDHDNDKFSGKQTLAVRMGKQIANRYHFSLLLTPVLLTLFYGWLSQSTLFYLLATLMFLPVRFHLKRVFYRATEKSLDPELKKVALFTFLYAILFSVLLILGY
jgi:1,4-dihydroxy-2-naphthoate octaprenyltransferase